MHLLPTSLSLLILALVHIACGNAPPVDEAQRDPSAESASPHTVDVIALDYAFGMPATIPSGWTTFRMENRGEEHHLFAIQSIPEGIAWEELLEGVTRGEETGEWPEWISRVEIHGGPGLLAPGEESRTTVHLEPGEYIITCGVRTPEGVVHWMKGMRQRVTVTESQTETEAPSADIEMAVRDFEIATDRPVTAGRRTIRVTFEGPHKHSVHLARLGDGETVEEVIDWVQDLREPAPVAFLGGAEPMYPGHSATFTAYLEPGRYAWVCSHHPDRMTQPFTVPEEAGANPATAP